MLHDAGLSLCEHLLVDDQRRIEPAVEPGENVLGRRDAPAGPIASRGQAGDMRAEEDALGRKERVIRAAAAPRRSTSRPAPRDPPRPQSVGERRLVDDAAARRC